MKKILALILALAMVLCLVACGEPEAPKADAPEAPKADAPAAPEAPKADDGKIRILLSNAYYTAPYCAAYNPSALAKAEELGIELTILDANSSQQTALEHVNLAVAEGYDGFMYFPADVDGSYPVIDALNESGIAWIGVNSYSGDIIDEVGMKYLVAPDSSSHGVSMSEAMMQLFPDGCNYVTIAGLAGHSQTIAMDGKTDELLDASKYVCLDYQNADFAPELAMTKMADMLTAYGLSCDGGKIDCIMVQDGGMSTGVVSALEAAGYKPGDVKLIACGSNKIVYDSLMSGWLSASSTQDPISEAALAVEVLYNIIQGTGTVEEGWTRTPTPVAYPENADEFNWF